jgi:hypothetical protein
MIKEKKIVNRLKNNYFWDVNISKIEGTISSRLIIKRVFSLGSVEDMKTVIAYYGRQKVEEVLENVNYLDPKTLQFVSVIFDKPKEEFKCFKQTPSARKYWNF